MSRSFYLPPDALARSQMLRQVIGPVAEIPAEDAAEVKASHTTDAWNAFVDEDGGRSNHPVELDIAQRFSTHGRPLLPR